MAATLAGRTLPLPMPVLDQDTMAVALADRLQHDDRVEEGSFIVPPATFPETTVPDSTDARQVAADAVATLNKCLAARDYAGVGALFAEDGHWRDHLAVSWDFRTLPGPAQIAAFLTESAAAASQLPLLGLAVDEAEAHRAPVVAGLDVFNKSRCVLAYVTLTSRAGTGRGVIRLIHTANAWKIYALYTALEELAGTEPPLGARRPLGASHGGGRDMKTWKEQREAERSFAGENEPAVLVLGAGQGGLTLAARLKMLGVRTLVVDREAAVGDNWRSRYRQLVLHDPVWFDHMPYLRFPAFWPVFTPKDKLADFFEAYVALLELNVWTRTAIRSLAYDAAAQRYTVALERTDASGAVEARTFHPRHVVQATGHSGKKNIPDIPGMDAFQGALLCHSSEFPGAQAPAGDETRARRAVVVGSCNSGHDIAQDLHENGYDVTMVQRSSTCVVSSKAIMAIGLGALFSEAVQARLPVDDADLLLWSAPTRLAKAVQVQLAQREAEHDAPLLAGLAKAGFRLDRGTNGAGLFFKYFQRGGGYYIDVGASQLIAEGKIKVHAGHAATAVTADGIRLADGTHLPADVIVFATGYQNMRTQTRVLFGDAIADATRNVWGFDREGEFRTMWRRSGQPGYWYMGGNLALARYFSRLLALQIKAQEDGLMSYT